MRAGHAPPGRLPGSSAPCAKGGPFALDAVELAGLLLDRGHGGRAPEEAAILRTRQPRELVAAYPHHIIPLPTPGRVRTQVRTRTNRFYLNYQTESHGGGQGDLKRDGAVEKEKKEGS